MKHFIYYDDRLLASYYAQVNGGLATQKHQLVGDTSANTSEDGDVTLESNIEGKINFLVANAKAGISAQVKSPSASFSETQIAMEVVTSAMHDNIFDRVFEHAKQVGLIKNDAPMISDFMDVQIPLRIANLDDLTSKFSSGTFQKAMKDTFYGNALIETDEENPKMSPENWQKERRKIAERVSNDKTKEFIANLETVKGMMEVSPVKLFMFGEYNSHQLIIPIKSTYVREPLDFITNFMAGNVQVFGRVSKIGMASPAEGTLGSLNTPIELLTQKTIALLCSMPVNEETIILFPMAIYFQ